MTRLNRTRGRILVVDDTPTNVAIMEEILEERFELATAYSGEEALDVVVDFKPDIILLDIMMPGIDGYEVCRRIRDDEALKNTKVIMVSAKALVSERLAGYEAGANDYVTKPFEEEELLAKIQVFLQLKFAEELIAARQAGMSEIAAGVLHNVGNVLNSINISVWQARKTMDGAQIGALMDAADMVVAESDNWERFVTEDVRGRMLPQFLKQMAKHLKQVQDGVLSELAQLGKNVEHVRKIVSVQQDYARIACSSERFSVEDLVEDALQLHGDALAQHGIRVERQFLCEESLDTDRHKLLQVLTNLIGNAKDALIERLENEPDAPDPMITVRTLPSNEGARIEVEDNGSGIAADQISSIFQHGFTTKRDGHGFGLHSSANAARALGGSLSVHSEGRGRGARFTVDLPSKSNCKRAA